MDEKQHAKSFFIARGSLAPGVCGTMNGNNKGEKT